MSDVEYLDGAFLETALSAEDVDRAVVEESRLGVDGGVCAFLGVGVGVVAKLSRVPVVGEVVVVQYAGSVGVVSALVLGVGMGSL